MQCSGCNRDMHPNEKCVEVSRNTVFCLTECAMFMSVREASNLQAADRVDRVV